MALVAGEYGSKQVRVNADFDVSAATALALAVTRPDGTAFQRTLAAGEIAVGTVDVLEDGVVILEADKYVLVDILDGDYPDGGDYKVKLTATFAAGPLKSVNKIIEVEK